MNKEFVPYELAVKLKQLGFDEPCFARFNNDGDLLIAHTEKYIIDNGVDRSEFFTLSPLFQQAFRWFREKHDFSHAINKTYGGQHIPYVNGEELDLDSDCNEIEGYKWLYTSYEEAELACIDKLIEIVETKQQEQ
jgi:hypothetical protein